MWYVVPCYVLEPRGADLAQAGKDLRLLGLLPTWSLRVGGLVWKEWLKQQEQPGTRFCGRSTGQGACPGLWCSGCTPQGHPAWHEPPRPLYRCVVRGLKEGNAPCETACLHLFFHPLPTGSPTAAHPSEPLQPRVAVLSPGSAHPHTSRAAAPASHVLPAPLPGHPPLPPWAAKQLCVYPCHCPPALC